MHTPGPHLANDAAKSEIRIVYKLPLPPFHIVLAADTGAAATFALGSRGAVAGALWTVPALRPILQSCQIIVFAL